MQEFLYFETVKVAVFCHFFCNRRLFLLCCCTRRIDLDAVVEETYNEAMRLYEYYERMNDEIAKQEAEEAAKAREAEGLPVVMDAELVGEPQEVRHVEVGSVAGGFLLVRWRVSGVYTTLGVFVDTTAAGWLLLLMVLGASRRFYHAIDLNHH